MLASGKPTSSFAVRVPAATESGVMLQIGSMMLLDAPVLEHVAQEDRRQLVLPYAGSQRRLDVVHRDLVDVLRVAEARDLVGGLDDAGRAGRERRVGRARCPARRPGSVPIIGDVISSKAIRCAPGATVCDRVR